MDTTLKRFGSLRVAFSLFLLAAALQAHADSKLPPERQNPVRFSYPYFDGTHQQTISELRDPAVIRVADTYYLAFTHFPFTHHTSADAGKPDNNSSPGIRLYSSQDLQHWTFEKWLVRFHG